MIFTGLDSLSIILLAVGLVLFMGYVLASIKFVASLRQVLYVVAFACLFGIFVASLFPEVKLTFLSILGMAIMGVVWLIQKIRSKSRRSK